MLRRNGGRGRSGDGRVSQIVRLVAAGLDAVPGKHGVRNAHTAAAAVFDDQIRIGFKNVIQPFQIGPVVSQQPVPGAVRIQLCPDARIDVVVHLDITRAVLFHQPPDYPVRKFPHLRIAEIQLVAAVVDDPFAVAHKEPVVRQFVRHGTVDADYLDLQPQTGHHALLPDIGKDLIDPVRPSLLGRFPFPYPGPPGTVGIPARVDGVIFAADFRSRVDEGIFLFRRGISPQAVHKVVENDRELLVVLIFAADRPPVGRHFPHRVLKACVRGRYRHRDALEGFPGF